MLEIKTKAKRDNFKGMNSVISLDDVGKLQWVKIKIIIKIKKSKQKIIL